ncbi:MAG: DUF4097 domain-containing protein [Ruminococcaceae bacterium]|nr:DUF4097 domain-containing protein [Oscillospiraceae bacterium]
MKRLIIVAVSLFIVGTVLFVGAFAALDYDFSKLNTVKYTSNTYTPEGDFDKVYIKSNTADVELLPSKDGRCKVVCQEKEAEPHKVRVENGTLRIEVSKAKWYNKISFFSIGEKISVYLPEAEYTSLTVITDTGDISAPKAFAFDKAKLESDTGDISCAALSESIVMKSDTGDIKLTADAGKIYIETNTGDITLNGVLGKSLELESDTGDVLLKNSILEGKLEAETNTGDIEFDRFDAKEIFVETDTGDVEGSLLSDKIFLVKTDTGHIDVPESVSGDRCEIETDTGDVEIRIKK